MPRRPRVFVEGGVYHVYNRVASGDRVFGDPEVLTRWLAEVCARLRDEPDLKRRLEALDGSL